MMRNRVIAVAKMVSIMTSKREKGAAS